MPDYVNSTQFRQILPIPAHIGKHLLRLVLLSALPLQDIRVVSKTLPFRLNDVEVKGKMVGSGPLR